MEVKFRFSCQCKSEEVAFHKDLNTIMREDMKIQRRKISLQVSGKSKWQDPEMGTLKISQEASGADRV